MPCESSSEAATAGSFERKHASARRAASLAFPWPGTNARASRTRRLAGPHPSAFSKEGVAGVGEGDGEGGGPHPVVPAVAVARYM
jgi:hypothetical protein